MIRKVRIPLKFKIIALITALLLAAISFFVLFALDLFHKDKSAYIFETTTLATENLATQTNSYLGHSLNSLKVLSHNYQSKQNKKILVKLFESNPNLLEFKVFSPQKTRYKNILSLSNKSLLELYAYDKNHLKEINKLYPLPFRQIKKTRPYIKNSSIPGGVPHLTIAIRYQKNIFMVRVLLASLLDALRKNDIYQSAILARTGEIIATNSQLITKNKVNLANAMVKSNIDTGTQEVQLDQNYLLSFSKIPLSDLYAVSVIDKEKAYETARFLIQKSIYISILIVAIAAIFGIFFSKTLTSHLEKLFQATRKIAKGDFSSRISIKARDEIGVLSDSFNYMSQEITRYMEEMKEKARVENELAVAKLVQESFFPSADQSFDKFDLSAFYTPATECGGDWWGHIEHRGKLILFIADATGHGVPAAFLTATANCCSNNLKYLADKRPELLSGPSQILEIMNHAICNIAENILMTCFVAIIDPQKGTLTYSNASHNPPLLYHPKVADQPQKSDLKPLIKAQGPRLGHHANSTFEQIETEIFPGDQLVLFTDGVIESTNPDNKQWGQRNFLKTLLKTINSGPRIAVTSVIDELKCFCDGVPYEDDITFIITRMKS